ncbi:MAG: J domain-containing protein [Pseudomonadota bacterium]
MSIGQRLTNLFRANFNALLERASDLGTKSHRIRIEELSDAELELELENRRQRRDAAIKAANGLYEDPATNEIEENNPWETKHSSTSSRNHKGSSRRQKHNQEQHLARLYAQLECPFGADLVAVRKAYRVLMRKYHPDMHNGDPEKQRLATELSQKLTNTYNELRQKLT